MKKKILIGIGIFAVVAILTNPGKLEVDDFASEMGLPSQDIYYNCILFSCGNEWGANGGYVRKDDGSIGYQASSSRYKYIGLFNNFFIISENPKTKETTFQFMSKP